MGTINEDSGTIGENPEDTILSEEQADFALQRSGIYRFLATAFNQLPDLELAENLKKLEAGDMTSAFTLEGEMPSEMAEGLQLIEDYVLSCKTKAHEEITTELGVDRARLLRGVRYADKIPAPYESLFLEDGQEAYTTLIDVRKCYREAGLSVSSDARERADYIGIELDFMHYLTAQEAVAWQENDSAGITTSIENQHSFLANHLALWAPKFCRVMFGEATTDFYRGIARLLEAFMLVENERIIRD